MQRICWRNYVGLFAMLGIIKAHAMNKGERVMEINKVAKGFRAINGNDLRALYVVVSKLHTGHLLASKASGFVKTEQRLYKKIQKEVEAYTAVTDAQVQLGLFLEISKKLQLPKVALTDETIIVLGAQAMVEAVYQKFTAHDKLAAQLDITHTPLDAILEVHVQQMIRFYKKEFAQLSPSQQREQYEKFAAAYEQEGMLTLNEDTVAQVLYAAAPGQFTKQIELMALFIQQLPTVQLDTSLDPVLAVFMHPHFLKFDVFGISSLSVTKQLSNTQTLFLGIALTALAVFAERSTKKQDMHILIAHWQHIVNQRAKMQTDIDTLHLHIDQHRVLDATFKDEIIAIEREIKAAQYDVKQLKEALYAEFNITRADMEVTDTAYHAQYNRYKEAEREVNALRQKYANAEPRTNLLSKLTSKVKTTAANLSIKAKEREKQRLFEGMVDIFIELDTRYLAAEKHVIRQAQQQVNALVEKKVLIEEERAPIIAAIKTFEENIAEKERGVQRIDQKFYSVELGIPSSPTAPLPLPEVDVSSLDLDDILVETDEHVKEE